VIQLTCGLSTPDLIIEGGVLRRSLVALDRDSDIALLVEVLVFVLEATMVLVRISIHNKINNFPSRSGFNLTLVILAVQTILFFAVWFSFE
jgi:hypothetical protein